MAKTPAKKSNRTNTKPVKAKATPTPKAPKPTLGGYVVLARGKALALTISENYPRGGILERSDRGTLFLRQNAAQAALRRTGKYRESNAKAVNPDTCEVIRLDKLEP